MHRKGHVGMALLAYAPVTYVLVSEGKPALAVLCWLGIHTVEPFPDFDFHLPVLTHRGVSHSLLAVVVVGGVLGAVGWFLGGNLFDLLLAALLAGGDLFGWILGRLPAASAEMINLLLPNVSLEAVVSHARQIAGESANRWTFAAYGLFVGAYGIFAHLLGDVITISGIKPFLPLSRWRLSLSSLRADSPTANSGLFFLGVLAVGVVLAATVPSLFLGTSASATLSPVGIASGQDAGPLVTPNGSVEINETRSTRQRIVLESVTLPRNGFIVAQTGTGNVSVNQSSSKTKVVGHTQYVRHGTFRGVVLTLDTPIRGSATVSVSLWNDTNSNQTLDIGSGKADAPYQKNGTPIHDSIQFGANQSQRQNQSQNTSNATASVTVSNQTAKNGSVVTIKRATLPTDGFIALHTSEYVRGPASAEYSIIAVSDNLSVGTHRNITINVSHAPPGNPPGLNRSQLNSSQTLSAVVYRDNGNHRFDFVRSFGENDTAITNNGSEVRDSVRVRVPTPKPTTASVVFRNQTLQNNTLVVKHARLPDGGFVVAHNASYRQSGDPLTSVVGVSDYLPPGNHTNVSLDVSSSALARTQVVTIRPSFDTNGNRRYDYVTSDGLHDVAYETVNHSAVVTETALVRVPGTDRTTQQSRTQPALTQTPAPTTGTATKAPSTPGARGEGGSGGLFGSFGIGAIAAVVVVIVVLPTLIRKFF